MQERLWNKYFLICLVLQFFYMLSFNMTAPLIAQYSILLGESTAMAGLIAGMFSFCALVFRPVVGYIADRVNRTRFLTIGLICGTIGMAGYGFSQTAFMLICFRLLHSLAMSIQTTLLSVIAIEFIPKTRIAEGVGYVGIAATIGMSIGPGLGIAVSEHFTHIEAFFGSAFFMALTLILSFVIPNTHQVIASKSKFSLKDMIDIPTLPLSIAAMSFAFCAGLTSSFLVLLGEERSISGIAAFFFVSSVGIAVIRPIAGRITDRHGISGITFGGFISECIVLISIAFANSLLMIGIGSIFRIFGQGAVQSSLQGYILKESPDEKRGVASSTFYLGIDAGQGLGAIVGGAVAGYAGYTSSFLSGLVVLAIGLISFLWWKSKNKKMQS